MLLVGYDRKNKVFIAKNSWGYDNKEEEGFTLFSYDWATNGNIKWGIYITKIIENPKVNEREKQKFIGRWTFSLNGRDQILDINRIPLFYYLDWYEPLKIYSATLDYRLGGFHFVQNREGKSTGIFQLRVNGTIHGNQVSFYTDLDNENDRGKYVDDLTGTRFTMCMFSDNPLLMVGHCNDINGNYRTFYAFNAGRAGDITADDAWRYDPYRADDTSKENIASSDFKGFWDINRDGNTGMLYISGITDTNIEAYKDIKGTYTEGGKTSAVTGTLELRFDNKTGDYLYNTIFLKIPLKDGSIMDLSGSLNRDKKSIMCGLYTIGPDKISRYPWIGQFSTFEIPKP